MSKKYVTGRDSGTGLFAESHKGRDGPYKGVYRDSRSGQFIVGSEGMAKLNAIEGIKQSRDSRKMFADFERDGTSPDERRRTIIAKHTKKG